MDPANDVVLPCSDTDGALPPLDEAGALAGILARPPTIVAVAALLAPVGGKPCGKPW